ncbi:hypothetical protein ACFL4G_08755 [Thermodesulfobacteriota bacterium]
MSYLFALILTLAVEIPLVLLLLRKRAPLRFTLTAVIFGNLVSHPLIHLVPPQFFPSREVFIIAVESAAVVIEALTIFFIARPRPGWLAPASSLAANAASFFLGAWIVGMPL